VSFGKMDPASASSRSNCPLVSASSTSRRTERWVRAPPVRAVHAAVPIGRFGGSGFPGAADRQTPARFDHWVRHRFSGSPEVRLVGKILQFHPPATSGGSITSIANFKCLSCAGSR
jgi:hypothetical protein